MNINIKYWKERIAKQEAENQKLAEQARKEANLIVEVLIRDFGITKAILFGSLTKGTFSEESDIDLAVEGLKSADYFPALAAANRQTYRWVDLKPLEDLYPHFKEKLFSTGECIYDARNI